MSEPHPRKGNIRRLWFLGRVARACASPRRCWLAVTHCGSMMRRWLGPNGIDVTIEMASPKVPDDDCRRADVDASQASPQVVREQKGRGQGDGPSRRTGRLRVGSRSHRYDERLEKAEGGRSKIAAVQTEAAERNVRHR